jgi:hypothetical protein
MWLNLNFGIDDVGNIKTVWAPYRMDSIVMVSLVQFRKLRREG